MSYLLGTLLGNTLVAIALAMLALLTMRLGKPALAHALWLLVLLKLVTPALVKAPVPAETLPAWAPGSLVTSADPAADVADEVAAGAPDVAPPAPASPLKLNPRHAIPALWLAGTVTLLTLAGVRIFRFRRALRSAPPADDAVTDEVASLARHLGLDWSPDVRPLPNLPGPMIYFDALARPTLALPAGLLDAMPADRRRAILSHELAHLRRGDHWVRLLELAVTSLLWWHPLVWLAKRGLHEAEEQSCDAWVVWAMPDSRHAYASALVDVVERFPATGGAVPPVASGLGQFTHLKRRIAMIATQTPSRTLSLAAKTLVTLAVLALPVAPHLTRAGAQDNTGVSIGQDPAAEPSEQEKKLQLERKLARPPEALQEMAPVANAANTPEEKDRKIRELEDRISALELHLANAEQARAAQPAKPAAAPAAAPQASADPVAAPRAQIDALRAKARQRSAQDARKYSRDQLMEAENLYQVANKNWRTPEANQSLEQMVAKFPDINRTGCAVLYLGQYSQGDERVRLMTDAYQKHGDCFYFNGVQVGAYARLLLADTLLGQGKKDEANKLMDEVLKDYPNAIDHSGRSLAKVIEKIRADVK